MSGGGGGGPSQVTQISKSELPGYAQPYAEQLMSRGAIQSQQPYSPYSGQRIANFTPEQIAGLNMTRDRALTGAPDINAARNQLAATNAGMFINSNPWFENTVQSALGDVTGKVNAQFNRPGAFGGTSHQGMLQSQLGDLASKMRYQNYADERTNMLRAASIAPQYAQTDYQDAQALLGVGDVYGQRQQDLLNQQYQDWIEAQNFPLQQLDILANTLAGATGGRSTTIQSGAPVQYNRAASALGGGLLGAGLGSMVPASSLGGYGNYAPYIGGALGAGLGLWA